MSATGISPRQRLVRTLSGQPADRAPFLWWLGFAPWSQTLDRWRRESGISDLDPRTFFGFEPWFEVPPLEWGPLPRCTESVIGGDSEFVVSLDYRGITRRDRRDGASMPEWIAHPVTGPAGWRRYKEEHLSGTVEMRCAGLEGFARGAESRDAAVQVGEFPWGTFGTLRDLLGVERCLLAFYDEPAMVHEIIDTYVDLWLSLYNRVHRRVRIDHIHIWEDMSGKQGSLISMPMVEEFLMPSYDRIAAFARERGIPVVSVDTDGKCDELIGVMSAHGVNAYMPFEAQAGNDIVDVRRRYPRLGIMGGLDKSALAKGRNAIMRELDKAERMLERGGYVVGFDHLIPPDVPWESYKSAVTELRKMTCGGGS